MVEALTTWREIKQRKKEIRIVAKIRLSVTSNQKARKIHLGKRTKSGRPRPKGSKKGKKYKFRGTWSISRNITTGRKPKPEQFKVLKIKTRRGVNIPLTQPSEREGRGKGKGGVEIRGLRNNETEVGRRKEKGR